MGWLWHRRLAHAGMKNLHKLLKGEHVLSLTNVTFEKDRPYAACQVGKQVGSSHHSKNVMTTSCNVQNAILGIRKTLYKRFKLKCFVIKIFLYLSGSAIT
jgi:hypothetical protein